MKVTNGKSSKRPRVKPIGRYICIGLENIDQELAILRTFHIHKKVIEDMNLEVQYFREENYRQNEIFKDVPVEVTNIKFSDTKIVGKLRILFQAHWGGDWVLYLGIGFPNSF